MTTPTDEQIRVACAEAMGWKINGKWVTRPNGEVVTLKEERFPDYPNDLQACASLRASLTEEERRDFVAHLWIMVGNERGQRFWTEEVFANIDKILSATARQICLAFLAAKGVTL